MIVRDRPSGLRLFLTLRGSILPSIWKILLICRTIEIDLRDALGDPDLPPPLLPVDNWLR